MQKKYVSVNAEVDTDGVIRPLLIRWHDGRQWEVTKVLHTCTASHDEFEGVRYTVKIGRAVRICIGRVSAGMLTAPRRRCL